MAKLYHAHINARTCPSNCRLPALKRCIAALDNDGLPDIFFVTGNAFPQLAEELERYPAATPRVVFRNLGNGRVEEPCDEAGPASAVPKCSRGCAFGDFDHDRNIDILILNLNQPTSLLRNKASSSGNWLEMKLVGSESNRSCIEATVVAVHGDRRQAVLSQSSFHCVNDSCLHFGRVQADSEQLPVQRPTGMRETFAAMPANVPLRIEEGTGVVVQGC